MYHKLARELRKNMTETERLLWSKLRGKQFGGFKFRKQAPIGRFIVDFVCFDRKVVVELDGSQHAASAEDDQKRTEWLNSQRFRVLRFWNHEVVEDADTVMEAIWLALQTPPTLALPHKGGGDQKVDVPQYDNDAAPATADGDAARTEGEPQPNSAAALSADANQNRRTFRTRPNQGPIL